MRTPKLTKSAQNATLSAKKSKKKDTIKNVLASPFSNYWPIITKEESLVIKAVLLEHLPSLVVGGSKIPWSELRSVPKGERKKYKESQRKSKLQEGEELPAIPNRDGIILGINDITKSLENRTTIAVLITKDVCPKVLVQHVINQSVLLKIPVLIVEDLRNIIKHKCGFASAAIAFTYKPKYKTIYEHIKMIAKYYPVPENHINFKRSQEEVISVLDDSTVEEKEVNMVDSSIIEITESESNLKQSEVITILDESSIITDTNPKPETVLQKAATSKKYDFSNIYLKKTNSATRAFYVKPSQSQTNSATSDSEGFISFSSHISKETNTFLRSYNSYKPLTVKSVKADKERNLRKIEEKKKQMMAMNEKKK